MLSFTRRHMTFVWLAITPLLIADVTEAQNLISGSAIWQITYQMDGKDHTARFRGTTDGKILTAPIKKKKALSTVIGSWTGDAEQTILKVTEGNVRYKGTYVLSLQKESDTPVWTGTFTDLSGKERMVTVRLLKD
jgi:hypothetical protein